MESKRIGVGFGVMVLKGQKILLGRRHDDPEKASSLLNGAGTWTMPGGKLHFGESFEGGAKRETLEETGISLKEVEVISINNDRVEGAHFVTVGLFTTKFTGDPQVMEPNEITRWQWFDLNKLPKPIYFPSQKILDSYTNKRFYTA